MIRSNNKSYRVSENVLYSSCFIIQTKTFSVSVVLIKTLKVRSLAILTYFFVSPKRYVFVVSQKQAVSCNHLQ